MSVARKIAKNTGLLMIASLFTNIMAFLWTIYTASYLGTVGFGILSAALALTGIFSVLADLGLSTYSTREVAKDNDKTKKYLSNIALIKVFLAIFTFIVLYLTIMLKDYPAQSVDVILIIGIYMIFTSFTALFNAIFQGHQRMEFQTIGSIINSSLLLFGILLAIYLKGDIITISLAYLFASIITLAYSIIVTSWKFTVPSFEFDMKFWKKTIINALPFGITGVFTTIYFWIDSVMLSFMQGDAAVGLYNAPYKLLLVMLSIYSVYMLALFPFMSQFYVDSSDALKLTYRRSYKYMLILSLPVAVGTTILAQEIILFIYTPQYLPSVLALQILIWSIVFMFINGLSANLLGSIDKQLAVTKITGIGAVVNVGINLVIIPIFSFYGASVATVFTEFLIMILFTRIVSKTEFSVGNTMLKDLWRILIPCIAMLGVLVFLKLPLLIMIFISAIVYIIGILLTKAIDNEDISMIKGMINKNRSN
ncbi:MAG: flippase [Methanobacteriaceae archaeon]|nr:flippase [Methanobacteriaceae archaeon]